MSTHNPQPRRFERRDFLPFFMLVISFAYLALVLLVGVVLKSVFGPFHSAHGETIGQVLVGVWLLLLAATWFCTYLATVRIIIRKRFVVDGMAAAMLLLIAFVVLPVGLIAYLVVLFWKPVSEKEYLAELGERLQSSSFAERAAARDRLVKIPRTEGVSSLLASEEYARSDRVVSVDDTMEEKATTARLDALLSGTWIVRSEDSFETEYTSYEKMRAAIQEGRIRPDDTAARIKGEDGKPIGEPKWEPVSEGLGRLCFDIHCMFQPVWAHTLAGAAFTARLGIVLFLSANAALFLGAEAYGVACWLGVIAYLWCVPWLARGGEAPWQWITTGVSIPVFLSVKAPGLQIWDSLSSALLLQFGATVGGALFSVFPGMIAGTLVGWFRRRKLDISPYASREHGLVVKGVVVPLACFLVVLVAHHCLADWFATWVD